MGLFNHGFFLAFLFFHGVCMLAVAAVQYMIFSDIKAAMNVTKTMMLIKYVMAYLPAFTMGVMFHGVMGVTLFAFLMLHLYMMGTNTTTNEMAKRQTVALDLRGRGQTYLLWSKSLAKATVPRLNEKKVKPQYLWEILPDDYKKPADKEEARAAEKYYKVDRKEAKKAFLHNHYSTRGFFGNIIHTVSYSRFRLDIPRGLRRLVSVQHTPFEHEACVEEVKKGE